MSLLERKQLRGPGAPRPPRAVLAGLAWDPGARCLAGQVPAAARLPARAQAVDLGSGKVSAEKGPSGVACLFTSALLGCCGSFGEGAISDWVWSLREWDWREYTVCAFSSPPGEIEIYLCF